MIGLALASVACGEGGESISTSTLAPPVTTTTTPATTTSTPPAPTTTIQVTTTTAPPEQEGSEIVIEGGEVVGGVETIGVDLGSMVHIVVVSDVAEHVHVHGYDLFFDVAPETPAEITFIADVPGVFEVELEGSHTLIAELEVS